MKYLLVGSILACFNIIILWLLGGGIEIKKNKSEEENEKRIS
jgi:hypothetical protein